MIEPTAFAMKSIGSSTPDTAQSYTAFFALKIPEKTMSLRFLLRQTRNSINGNMSVPRTRRMSETSVARSPKVTFLVA